MSEITESIDIKQNKGRKGHKADSIEDSLIDLDNTSSTEDVVIDDIVEKQLTKQEQKDKLSELVHPSRAKYKMKNINPIKKSKVNIKLITQKKQSINYF